MLFWEYSIHLPISVLKALLAGEGGWLKHQHSQVSLQHVHFPFFLQKPSLYNTCIHMRCCSKNFNSRAVPCMDNKTSCSSLDTMLKKKQHSLGKFCNTGNKTEKESVFLIKRRNTFFDRTLCKHASKHSFCNPDLPIWFSKTSACGCCMWCFACAKKKSPNSETCSWDST